ncbi:tetratricopeptide repeat protein [uncultured Mameliella sp.]|uniref:tetratricopeptide repeat protein n=1 Tax=uncultured Mameliella sp. TaxID=1447087 RepID=UPI002615B009|nr:tetratricopeptide repeat protein [uncultured Mameliella sp.]
MPNPHPAGTVTIPGLMAEAQAAQKAGEAAQAARLYAQVLELRPDHAGAWLARIEIALGRGKARRARKLCEAALTQCPGHRVAIVTKQARALEAGGARAEALALLEDLSEDAPGDMPLAATLAGMRHRAGNLDGAFAMYGRVLDLRPDHPGAWLARIEIALARGQGGRALELIEAATPLLPGPQARALEIKRVRALDAEGRLSEALDRLAPLRAGAPGDLQLALLEAGLMRRTGDLAGAETVYAGVLERDPGQAGAWLGRIDIAQTAGDPDRARALAEAGVQACPDHLALIARRAGLLVHMGQSGAAIAALEAALETRPGEPRLMLELARAELAAGHAAAAEARYAACLEADPDNAQARLGLAEAHEAQGAPEAGLAVLADHAATGPAPGLKAAELMGQAGQVAGRAALLDRLAEMAPRMNEPELLRLFKLGEQADHAGAALAVVDSLGQRARISPLVAQFLMTRARVIVPPDRARALQEALESRLAPSRVPEFRALSAALFSGPEEALAQARADLPSPRDTQGAALVGERLLDAGHARSGFRYLRACVARWPGAPHLRRQFLRACIETGQLAAGHAWLDRLEARDAELDTGPERMALLTQEGRLEETREMAEARAAQGLKTLSPRQFLDLALALGDLEASTRAAQEVQREPGAGRQNTAHFSTTLHGAQFNELRLYHAARDHALQAGEPEAEVEVRLARDFFFPAKRLVAAQAPRFGPRPGAGETVPRLIFQYWNSPAVPEEVAALMQSWRDAPGFDHHLYDRARALAFLRKEFGTGHARAFQLANSPAEECDFLRLCLLYKHGGIYADADDRLTGDAGALIAEGPGLILAREPWGAVANNVIAAPQGHPLLLWALEAAGRSLLARENDGTWFKTGPGLVTRATASWLAEAEGTADQGLTLLTLPQLRAHVHPHVRLGYKSSGSYWNARDAHAPGALVSALSGLAPRDGKNAND